MYYERPVNSFMVELTSKCNLKCKHCYVDSTNGYIDTNKLFSFIDTMKERGVGYVTLTGGEPMLHPDFTKIYNSLFDKNIDISLFTNLSLLDDKKIELFNEKKPAKIEATLYGSSKKEYKEFTGYEVDIDKQLERLSQININNILIKIQVTKFNLDRIDYYIALCNKYKFSYKFNLVMYNLDSNKEHEYQVDFRKFYSIYPQFILKTDNDFRRKECLSCSAGRTSFYLTHDFKIKPCPISTRISIDYKDNFDECWEKIGNYVNRKIPQNIRCVTCDMNVLCNVCYEGLFHIDWLKEDVGFNIYCAEAYAKKEFIRK